MVASLQFGTVSSYYVRDYYHGGEIQLSSCWYAPSGSFGLADDDRVDPGKFERLHAAIGDDGGNLLTTTRRDVEALDLTASASKSVSVAYATTPDETHRQEILDAHLGAVRAMLEVLDREAIYARRGHGGATLEKVALTAALFTHDSARPEVHTDGSLFSDPQLHSHCVILSLAERNDGTVGAIDTRIGKYKLLAGSVYHAHLANNLSKLGYTISDIGKNGTFEIGIDERIRDYFSARRSKIEEALEEQGLDSADAPDVAAAVALSTRRTKSEADGGDRFALWQARAKEQGLDFERTVADLRQADPNGLADEAELRRRLQAIPRELTENEATFARRDLMRAVAVAHVGTSVDPVDIVAATEGLIASGAVIEIRRDGHEPILSTPEMVRLERQTLEMAKALTHRDWRGVDDRKLAEACRAAKLSDEQRAAVAGLAENRPLAFLEGRAGVGKTHSLKPYVGRLKAEGYRVIATATAWRTAIMLEQDLGIEARALDSWLKTAESGGRFLDTDTVLLVDEAGQLGARATHALLSELTRAHATGDGAKIVLLGDRAQLAPIAASCGLDIIERAQAPIGLETVVRQRDPADRAIVEKLASGEIEAAVDALHMRGCIVERPNRRQATLEAVDRWEKARKADPRQAHLLLARTHTVIRGLNDEVRRRMRRDGHLIGDDLVIAAATPSGAPFDLRLAVGDQIRFGRRAADVGNGVINGTTAEIESIARTAPGQAEITARIDGVRVRFSTASFKDAEGRVRIAHDYAQTVYSAQGLTAETCVVVAEPSFDRHDLYVGASRARKRTTLIVDRAAVDAQVRANRPVSRMQGEITADERRAAMLSAWSRQRVKTTTIGARDEDRRREPDHDVRQPDSIGRRRGRVRDRGLDHGL